MTFALAAYCPWTETEYGEGIAVMADCELTGLYPTGKTTRIRRDTRKVFAMGKYALAAYAGSRRSAVYALRRTIPLFTRPSLEPGPAGTGRIDKALYDGAREAERAARTEAQRAQCGPFQALFGYINAAGTLDIFVSNNPYPLQDASARLWAAAVGPKPGIPRIFMMGSGMQAGHQFMSEVHRIVTDEGKPLAEQPFGLQAGFLAQAMLTITEKGLAPYSGGGVQTWTLTEGGVQEWLLQSAIVDAHVGGAPDWKTHRAETLQT
jgi:hypothetical protein